ncbi:MAG: ExbD/TolR family protein [Burkholderiaceae bacterium]|jgi:biopolymer transport protein ExbD|nr:biopolymer transporter ExbD [Burkholderiaceae bacterium]MBU6290499.1 biopolymer transporter ExbD [Burkholderiales bacterium]NCV86261.1 biopolymer transporter ExbD [Oxalobacteraceae bacterium]NCW85795.1 biopolymer transporter ExbD [Oxalobacteraceae bacterium]NDG08141.1 biopolymer transporter ExbD [Oxalobacteraceae bacterium]
MAFGGFNDNSHQAPMAEINVTPMVDVMLVLLVIFIITAPLFTHAVKLELPTASSAPAPEKPESITLAINAEGKLFWNNTAVTMDELGARFTTAAQKTPQPELQLRADKSTRYEVIAQVMSSAQTNGMTKIGFVTNPKDVSR